MFKNGGIIWTRKILTGEQVCPPITGQNGQPIPLHRQRNKVGYIISSSLACVKGAA